MINWLHKLKDKVSGSHYEFDARHFASTPQGDHDTLIIQGSFAGNNWQVTTAKKHVEEYPPAGCCGADSFVVTKPIAHLSSPSGKETFTNEEVLALLKQAYPDPAKAPVGEQLNLNAFFDLAKICA